MNHIDTERAKLDKDTYVAPAGDDDAARADLAKIFDSFEVQRSYSVDSLGRPYWFDFAIESIGVIPAKDLLHRAAAIYKKKIETWCNNPIQREDDHWYSIETEEEGHTIGALAQILIYGQDVNYVSYRIVHPLLPKMIVRFNSRTMDPEKVIAKFKEEAVALCETILKSV
jgi:DNA-directed RNA polymerase subunit L